MKLTLVLMKRLLLLKAVIIFMMLIVFHHCIFNEEEIAREQKSFSGLVQMTSPAISPWNIFINVKPNFNISLTLHQRFNITSQKDILIFMHIPKTAGKYFLLHMLSMKRDGIYLCRKDMKLEENQVNAAGQFVCPFNGTNQTIEIENIGYNTTVWQLPPMWLYSERTYGWACKVHPFYSQLKNCVPRFYVEKYGPKYSHLNFWFSTVLRHPVVRYLNELVAHKNERASWGVSTGLRGLTCSPEVVSEKTVPECYRGFYKALPWKQVTLSEFLSCPHNWANNRQTWMIADLENIFCSKTNRTFNSKKEMEDELLQSAKENLRKMAFFGISEYLKESSLLFEYTFDVSIDDPIDEEPVESKWHNIMLHSIISHNITIYEMIVSRNHLDMRLYEYGLELFSLRLNTIGFDIDKNKLLNNMKSFNLLLV
jgi:hypothetical protein